MVHGLYGKPNNEINPAGRVTADILDFRSMHAGGRTD